LIITLVDHQFRVKVEGAEEAASPTVITFAGKAFLGSEINFLLSNMDPIRIRTWKTLYGPDTYC